MFTQRRTHLIGGVECGACAATAHAMRKLFCASPPMKRDLELIRKILVAIEEKQSMEAEEITLEGYDFETIAFHLVLLNEARFIKAIIREDESGEVVSALAIRLTWDGSEFLQVARNDNAWNKSKKLIGEKSISVSIAILTELLKSLVKETLGLK